MAIRAVVFDIGGVLEITPDLGTAARWEPRLGLPAGELHRRLGDVWAGSRVGALTEDQVHQALTERLGLDEPRLAAFMADVWREYLGRADTELIEYTRGLRPRLRTGIVSNSMAGAREREQAAYGFEDLVDDIVYSHEVGLAKPDPRIYALACTRLGVSPAEMVFVDDVEQNVTSAREAGLHAVFHRDTPQTIAALNQLLAG
jgi:epoxide hydrolase-like predicted phosphatase